MGAGTENGEAEKSEEELKRGNVEMILDLLFEHIDEQNGVYINRLRDFVEFPTISTDPFLREELPRMATFLVRILKKFGMEATVMNMVEAEGGDKRGDAVPLIFAETKIDPDKKTMLFYSHYDVNPINYHECWSDPFELTLGSDGSKLLGKGSSASKGPLLCVINAIGAYLKMRIALPVNVKMVLDPLGTLDEDATGKFLKRIDTGFFYNVDSVCLCMGKWLGTIRPCVSHGARGICNFSVTVEGPSKDLHSGAFGGVFIEPMADLIYVLNGLVDKNGTILITDIYKDVLPVSDEERKFFKSILFSVRELKQDIGAPELLVNEDKASILMRLWRQPSLTVHGIQGAFSEPGTKNVIPGKVTGKFSINLVPNMSPSSVKKKVVDYMSKVWKARKSTNKIRIQMTEGKLFWYTDPTDVNVIAAKTAVAKAYSTEPDLIREPNRTRMVNVLKKLTGSSVIMIPIGKTNDVTDSSPEKLDVSNYIHGIKILASYMMYFAEFSPQTKTLQDVKCTCKITGQLSSCTCYLKYPVVATPPPLEDETLQSKDWLGSVLSPGMNGDERPDVRYYRMTFLALNKLQKLQEVLSLSHLAQSSLSTSRIREVIGQEAEPFKKNSRAVLESFSVANLHDLGDPRKGGWLSKRFSDQENPSSEDIPLLTPASSMKILTKQSNHSVVALHPTVFSFKTAQTLIKGRTPFKAVNNKFLWDLKTVQRGERPQNGTCSKSDGELPKAMPALEIGAKSAPDLTIQSDVKISRGKEPGKMSINPVAVVSSTSRILYKKRLERTVTDSALSLLNFQGGVGSTEDDDIFVDSVPVSRPEVPAPRSPINTFGVVFSLPKVLNEKRLSINKTDSMKELYGGIGMGGR